MIRFARIALFACLASTPPAAAGDVVQFWVGASEAGIYAGELKRQNGRLGNVRQVIAGIEAHYIVGHPKLPILYAAIRTAGPSRLAAYRIAADGGLTLLNELDSRPHGISHINVSDDGRFLGAAYYRAGVAGIYRLDDDGRLSHGSHEVLHDGASRVDAERQEAPHPHYAGFSPDTRFMYVPDLGTDRVVVYEVDGSGAVLQLVQSVAAPPGSGPRHLAIHPSLDMAYVSDELSATVSRYERDSATGKLRYLDSMPPAPESAGDTNHTVSDIRIEPGGRFLYLVNRGFDRVSVFAIDARDGALMPVEREPVRGSVARNMNFDDTGHWALVGGRDSNTLALFRIDPDSGEMRYAHQVVHVETPMAIVFQAPHGG